MNFKRRLLISSLFPFYRLFRYVGQCFGLVPASSLRVLIFHETPEKDLGRLRKLLETLKKSHRFIDADQFVAMMSGKQKIEGHNLLLTFDDGFRSNRILAEQVLSPMGIRAVFFVATGFVGCDSAEASVTYVRERLLRSNLPAELSQPLTWRDLRWLIDQGHEIGAHTVSHARLSELSELDDLRNEIVSSGDELEKELGIQVRFFSYPFGDIGSISQVALSLIRNRYRFCFSGVRGDNGVDVNPMAIRREAIQVNDGEWYNRFFICGGGAFLYRHARKRLDAIAMAEL